MKRKYLSGIVAAVLILSVFSVNQGADRFYYGTYHWSDTTKDFSNMKDSLRLNILWGDCGETTIHHFTNHSLRAIVQNMSESEPNSPSRWAYKSYYTMWEAEGLEGSYYELSYHPGATLVDDPQASGGKAMSFSGSELALIQWGPAYYQEPKYRLSGDPIHYTAEFRLKYLLGSPLGPMGSDPPTPVCRLMVVDSVTVLKDTTLYKSDFDLFGGYNTFKLVDYTVPEDNRIEFQIYWFGILGTLYIDYVKVYDENGEWLMSGFQDSLIMGYVSQDWVHETIPKTGDTIVYRWYLRDEPPSVDLFATNRYIDSLLREVSPERAGMQVFNKYSDGSLVNEYFLRHDPEEYHVDPYPTKWWGLDSSGEQFQQGVDTLTKWLSTSKNDAENQEKDLWVTIQTFVQGWELLPGDTCAPGCSLYHETPDGAGPWWCCGRYKRFPTAYEVRLQTFLGLCYGADGIINWRYDPGKVLSDTVRYLIKLGLYDHWNETIHPESTKTPMWREIADFTGPRVEALGPVFNQLTWLGACSDDEVGSFIPHNDSSSYIDSITSSEEPHWVEVGFFSADTGQYTDYFMLVNRECLETEAADYDVFFAAESGVYRIRDMYIDSIVAVVNGLGDRFLVRLDAGEGKLLRLEPRPLSSGHIPVPQNSSSIRCATDGAEDGETVLSIEVTRIKIPTPLTNRFRGWPAAVPHLPKLVR